MDNDLQISASVAETNRLEAEEKVRKDTYSKTYFGKLVTIAAVNLRIMSKIY